MSNSESIDIHGRICRKCGEFKSWENFDKKSDGFNGHHSQCKSCIGKFKKKWWKKKNIKKRIKPTILEFASSDLHENMVYFTQNEKTEFEKILRSMVFDTFYSIRRKELK